MGWSLTVAASLYLGAAAHSVAGNGLTAGLLSGAGTAFLWTAWNQWRETRRKVL